jgi:transcriptional regulator with GAF, ATPase, and Fis domain
MPMIASAARQLDAAREISALAERRWGQRRPLVLVGRHRRLAEALDRVSRFAAAESPVLIMGETGTGKELFARAIYLLSPRRNRPFLAVNCAQYLEGHLIASELFGHKRGSFTGAVTDHKGVFEEADGGVVFLDEVGELSLPAQAMLLRALSEGEIMPVGATQARTVDVRVVAATSRDLKTMVAAGTFRADLYYRLRYLPIRVPPVRERGDDWALIAGHYLETFCGPQVRPKRLSPSSEEVLLQYHWPGNVREIRSVVDIGFHSSTGELIEPAHFAEELESVAREQQLSRIPIEPAAGDRYERMARGLTSFWQEIHRPYLNREISREDVRGLVERGLVASRGSYKRLLPIFGIAEDQYLRFMDFLRHHHLKPEAPTPIGSIVDQDSE